jgi:hypothetical protein
MRNQWLLHGGDALMGTKTAGYEMSLERIFGGLLLFIASP